MVRANSNNNTRMYISKENVNGACSGKKHHPLLGRMLGLVARRLARVFWVVARSSARAVC